MSACRHEAGMVPNDAAGTWECELGCGFSILMKRRTVDDLTYYLGYAPSPDLITEADEWQQDHPSSGLNEWVDAMREIGAL